MSDWDRQTTPGGVEGPQWVSAAEAADVAGVTPGTVRYWARNGLIVSEVVEGPAGEKTLVRLDEVLQHARHEAPSRPPAGAPERPPAPPARPGGEVVTDLPARTSELAPILQSIPEIMAQLTSATDRAARAETKVEFLSAQVADLRRRLAEAETGGDGAATVVMPEAWEQTETPVSTIAEETAEAAPASTGWPAPPPDALQDVPAEREVEEPEPGPEAIDWTSRDTSLAPEPVETEATAPEEPSPVTPLRASDDLSLDEIWNQPATPAPETRAVETHEPGPADVDWHEPAGPSSGPPAPPEPGSTPATRPANAPVPEGDDFYGPRRRRWFKRRG